MTMNVLGLVLAAERPDKVPLGSRLLGFPHCGATDGTGFLVAADMGVSRRPAAQGHQDMVPWFNSGIKAGVAR